MKSITIRQAILLATLTGFLPVSCKKKHDMAYEPGYFGQPQASAEYAGPEVVEAKPRLWQKKPKAARQAAVPAASVAAPEAPKYPKGWNPEVQGVVAANVPNVTYTAGSRALNYVALTFDDGPSAALTPRLLDILRERNAKATFYVLGPRVRARPDIVQRMVAEGHEIGNHSWTHRVMSKASDAAMLKEFQDTHDAVVAACGVTPKSQRPPYGAMTKVQRALLKDRFGYPCILWDVDPLDWKKPGSGVVASRILSGARGGSIILLHDIHAGSVDAVPQVLDGLLAKGYTFVTVSQLLALSGN